MGRIVTLEAHLGSDARVSGTLKRVVGFRATVGARASVEAGPTISTGDILTLVPGESVEINGVTIIVLEAKEKE